MKNIADENSSEPLDIFLREADTHIPDAGFTSRVMRKLPRQHAPRSFVLRYIILAIAIVASAVAAAWLLPPVLEVTHMIRFVTDDPIMVLMAVLPTLAVAASLCVGVWRMISEEAS